MTVQEEKRALRSRLLAESEALPERYLRQADAAILRRLLSMPDYRHARCVFCYVGVRREIFTQPLLEDALRSGKTLCVPRCGERGTLEIRQITSLDALSPGVMGLLEPPESAPLLTPDQVDFAVVPCLACSRDGRRLGYGGGYYDRFLAVYPGSRVVLCRELQLRQEIPVESHDEPIPWVLTERCLYEDGVPAPL